MRRRLAFAAAAMALAAAGCGGTDVLPHHQLVDRVDALCAGHLFPTAGGAVSGGRLARMRAALARARKLEAPPVDSKTWPAWLAAGDGLVRALESASRSPSAAATRRVRQAEERWGLASEAIGFSTCAGQ